MIDPHKEKYHDMYWDLAHRVAQQSEASRCKVGAVLVTTTGMLSIGWNGMPAGFENECEHWEDVIDYFEWEDADRKLVTKPEVIHAERNAIDKMTRQGIPTEGSLLFVTCAPCFECAKAIHGLGLKAVYYEEPYRCDAGIALLRRACVPVFQRHVTY